MFIQQLIQVCHSIFCYMTNDVNIWLFFVVLIFTLIYICTKTYVPVFQSLLFMVLSLLMFLIIYEQWLSESGSVWSAISSCKSYMPGTRKLTSKSFLKFRIILLSVHMWDWILKKLNTVPDVLHMLVCSLKFFVLFLKNYKNKHKEMLMMYYGITTNIFMLESEGLQDCRNGLRVTHIAYRHYFF